MPEPSLRDRLALVRTVIAERQARGGWQHPVQVLAVTKTHPATVVREAVAAGLTAVGENRVQEALHKQAECEGLAVDWHLIGGLQRNKVRQAVGRFAWIHSVDREELAADIADASPRASSRRYSFRSTALRSPRRAV